MSTDMAFREDKHNHKLYINSSSSPKSVTIEFIPKLKSAEDIQSDYWQDILIRMCVALTKLHLVELEQDLPNQMLYEHKMVKSYLKKVTLN